MTAAIKLFDHIDDLEHALIASLEDVARATHRFLLLLREFDLRQGWKEYGNTDCAQWLNWCCGITRGTAQEKVRVANALWTLPQIDEAFKRGRLSYSKVRALTRVANDMNETDLLQQALDLSADGLEAYCRQLRNGDEKVSSRDARRILERRSLTRQIREDGSGVIYAELPADDLALVMQAIDTMAAALPKDRNRSLFATAADALVLMARAAMASHPTEAGSDHYQVMVHVNAAALENSGAQQNGSRSDLPLATVKRLCCDGSLIPLLERDGVPLSVGRKQRVVPTAIKRALQARDRHCTFPGCHHDRFVDAHHIQHWVNGGETSLDNLTLLCTHHHRLVHEGGYAMRQHPDGKRFFARPDGRPVEVPECEMPAATTEQSPSLQVEEPRATYRVAALSAESETRFIALNALTQPTPADRFRRL